MANPILTYLPRGWTEDKLKNATDEDYESLTEEQLQKVMDRGAAEHHADTLKFFDEKNAERIARGARPIPYPHDDYNDSAGERGEQSQSSQQVIDPATQTLTNLLDHVEQSDLDIFGFVLFRTYYSGDEQSWEVFKESFWELIDEGTAAASADFNRIQDRVFIRFVSDNSLKNSPPEGVVGAYLICMEEEEPTDSDDEDDWGDVIEPGLTTNMCLYADEECITCLCYRLDALPSLLRTLHCYFCRFLLNGSQIPISTPCTYPEALAKGATTGCSHRDDHRKVKEACCKGTAGGE